MLKQPSLISNIVPHALCGLETFLNENCVYVHLMSSVTDPGQFSRIRSIVLIILYSFPLTNFYTLLNQTNFVAIANKFNVNFVASAGGNAMIDI